MSTDSYHIFHNDEQADIFSTVHNPRLVNILRSPNTYTTRSWNTEVATRYVFQIDNMPIEVSYFEHFLDEMPVKAVIELPLSFGCPIGCRYCASSLLNSWRPLNSKQIMLMFHHVLKCHASNAFSRLRIAFAGIGEGSLYRRTLAKTCQTIVSDIADATFMLTTVGRDASFISWTCDLAKAIPVDYLLISYLHYDKCKLKEMIPEAEQWPSKFEDIVSAIMASCSLQIRLNYVVIPGFNDAQEHPLWLIHRLDGLQGRVTIRISSLNETSGSRHAGLIPPKPQSLADLCKPFTETGFQAYCFASHRNDNMSCGQLAWNHRSDVTNE